MPFSLNLFSVLNLIFPDILSILALVTLIVVKNFLKEEQASKILSKISLLASVILLFAMLIYTSNANEKATEFFIYNKAIGQTKILLFFCLFVLLGYLNYSKLNKTLNENFFILIYGIINALTISISANNFLMLILALELYTFSLSYLLVNSCDNTFHRKCCVRFLLLSSIASSIFIFGCSLIYSQSGSLSFAAIKSQNSLISEIGQVLIICYILFKLGCAPFHSWVIDVYEKLSGITILFLEAIWKLFIIFVFIKVISVFATPDCLKILLMIFAIIAMSIGAIMPIFQDNIHKFIASISIGHVGFVVSSLYITQSEPAIMAYMLYNSFAIFCFFTGILFIKNYYPVKNFSDLSGIIKTAPIPGFTIVTSMFAMCGLPPFGNFIAKVNILKLFLCNKDYLTLVVAILYSLISIVYLIKWSRYFFCPSRLVNVNDNRYHIFAKFSFVLLVISIIFYEPIFMYFKTMLTSK